MKAIAESKDSLGVISNQICIFTQNSFFSLQFLETVESDLHILSSDLTHLCKKHIKGGNTIGIDSLQTKSWSDRPTLTTRCSFEIPQCKPVAAKNISL